jgi:hypothetical protein
MIVVPAEAGTQERSGKAVALDPRLRGGDGNLGLWDFIQPRPAVLSPSG